MEMSGRDVKTRGTASEGTGAVAELKKRREPEEGEKSGKSACSAIEVTPGRKDDDGSMDKRENEVSKVRKKNVH